MSSTTDNKQLEDAFVHIGLRAEEVRTLQALIRAGTGVTVLQLSRTLGVPRPTLYVHINGLIEKGMVRKELGEHGPRYRALTKKALLARFDDQSRKLAFAKEQADVLLDELPPVLPHHARFVVHDGPNAAELIFNDILRERPTMCRFFWPLKDMLQTIPPEVFAAFNEERVHRNIAFEVLWPSNKTVNIEKYPHLGSPDPKQSLRKRRVLPGAVDCYLGYGIYNTKVAFISSSRENYGFIIDSRELALTLESNFKYLWKLSRAC
jgi:sugar-specific transcriptional regulator TrmB